MRVSATTEPYEKTTVVALLYILYHLEMFHTTAFVLASLYLISPASGALDQTDSYEGN